MARFRKKPVVIEATQWFPPDDVRHDPVGTPVVKPKPGERKEGDITLAVDGLGPTIYTIKTLEGPMRLTLGDWVITGVKGEKYNCKPDIFAATYDPVE